MTILFLECKNEVLLCLINNIVKADDPWPSLTTSDFNFKQYLVEIKIPIVASPNGCQIIIFIINKVSIRDNVKEIELALA